MSLSTISIVLACAYSVHNQMEKYPDFVGTLIKKPLSTSFKICFYGCVYGMGAGIATELLGPFGVGIPIGLGWVIYKRICENM